MNIATSPSASLRRLRRTRRSLPSFVVVLFGCFFTSKVALAQGQEPAAPPVDDTEAEAGLHGGIPYLRAFDDRLRLYPEAYLRLDARFAPQPADLHPNVANSSPTPSLVLRRLNLGLSGELFRVLAFTAQIEMGGQRIGTTRLEGSSTHRWAPADAHDGAVRPGEISISVLAWPALNFTIGQVPVPFSLSNRTRYASSIFAERPLAIRGFAVPDERALGVMSWGEVGKREFVYEIGLFGGSSMQPLRPGSVDVVGRAFVRPFASLGRGVFFELAQVGLSARIGSRSSTPLADDLPKLATDQGFVLWQPGRINSSTTVARAVLEGAQRAIGGELRVPIRTKTNAVFDLRGEAAFVQSGTAEGSDSANTITTTRTGNLTGVSWYVSLDWWACFIEGFEQLVLGEPGMIRPTSVDDSRVPSPKSALEASIIAGGVHAKHDPDARQGSPTPKPSTESIDVFQFGGTVQYLVGSNIRAAAEYLAYFAPDSGRPGTGVVVPDNLPRSDGTVGDGHFAHEIGLRVSAGF